MEILRVSQFSNYNNISHGFFTRQGGVSILPPYRGLNGGLSSQDNEENIVENRKRCAGALGLPPENLLSCYQVHSPDVITVTQKWVASDRPRADAMVTAEKNLALAVLTADCVPVLFVDAKAGVIGAAHAGWRGALTGVLSNTIKAMVALGARASSIEAALGPCIWQASYEVGPEFPAPFLAENADNVRLFRPSSKPDHTLFDLPGYVVAKLKAEKIAGVEASPADTLRDPLRFFSYRRNCLEGDKRVGSLLSVIALKSPSDS